DIIISDTEPSNPIEGMVWLDSSSGPPYHFYVYTNGAWQRTHFDSLEELDPDQHTLIQKSYQAIRDLDEDGKLTRYERSVVRGELANIIGKHLAPSESMPTIEQIDSNGVGMLYALRKQAIDLGIPKTDDLYERVGNA